MFHYFDLPTPYQVPRLTPSASNATVTPFFTVANPWRSDESINLRIAITERGREAQGQGNLDALAHLFPMQPADDEPQPVPPIGLLSRVTIPPFPFDDDGDHLLAFLFLNEDFSSP